MNIRLLFVGAAMAALFTSGCARQSVVGEKKIGYEELAALLKAKPANFFLVDVRSAEEYASGHIPGAVNIPVDVVADQPPAEDRQARIVVYCRSGNRSAKARTALLGKGFTDVADFGAVDNWKGGLVKGDKPE